MKGAKFGDLYVINPNKIPSALYLSSKVKNELFHSRFGHFGQKRLRKIADSLSIILPDRPNQVYCESCIFGKHSRQKFNKSSRKTSFPGELIHTDIVGPLTKSRGGLIYICVLLDDYTDHFTVYLLSSKSEVAKCLETYNNLVTTSFDHNIKFVRSDNGGEYVNEILRNYFSQYGIQHEFTTAYTPQQNGKAERKNRTLIEMVRCMLHQAKLPNEFWAEAVATATYLHNLTTFPHNSEQCAHEIWSGHQPDYHLIKVWGCDAFAHIPKEKRKKLDFKSSEIVIEGEC